MNKRDSKHQSNLAFREFDLPAGGEWQSFLAGWNLMFVRQGSGYFLQPRLNLELETGALLLLAGQSSGSIRASQLGGLSLCSFWVIPDRLTSLITLPEQRLFRLPPDNDSVVKVLPPDNPVATRMRSLIAEKNVEGLLFRLKLLQLFIELFVEQPAQAGFPCVRPDDSDAMKRLQVFLKEMPASELMELEFSELAAMTHCTPRHLSRIFQKLVGMSFSDKRAELRLARAEELLATSSTKVVQVALESGYNSLSQFNLMFIRRYGISPGRWREKYGYGNLQGKRKKINLRFKPPQTASAVSPCKWSATGSFRLS
jgi:AraC-like DNA-binding protein